jgi:hypothetical protein
MNISKNITKVLFIIVAILALTALAGMYKFNYLSGRPGYDADGNKIQAYSEQSISVGTPDDLM